MKVKELIEVLKRMPKNQEVYFGYEFGDYWNSVVVDKVEGVTPHCQLVWSEYHKMMKPRDPQYLEDEDEDSGEVIDAVVLGSRTLNV
jgi:hypothetical protein